MGKTAWWSGDWYRAADGGLTLSIIVPVYNERYLVGAMLSQLVELELPGICEFEIVVVDDASNDGSGAILDEFAAAHSNRVRLLRHDRNRGKGSALRTGIETAVGDLIVFQDADLEYDPRDLATLVRPFLEDGADVVYGSRFATAARRRVLFFRHQLGNNLVTFLSNLLTDLNLSDVETCYKMFRGPLLKSIPLRSDDFAMEIEITAKVAKRGCSIFEVPISYRGRTYAEGKKIGWRDGVKALAATIKYWVIDDLYLDDAYGGHMLHNLERTPRFIAWIADTVRPWVGDRVLEVGAGIGSITRRMIPRDLWVAGEINPNYLHFLENFAAGKPYLSVARLDVEENCAPAGDGFDTVICLNVLEHLLDPVAALQNLLQVLEPGGRLIVYVPRGQRLYSPLDEALGRRRRYESGSLQTELETAGFEIEHLGSFNRLPVIGWWWNGKVLRRRRLRRLQLKLLDLLTPVLRRCDRFLPWPGIGLFAVARRRDAAEPPARGGHPSLDDVEE